MVPSLRDVVKTNMMLRDRLDGLVVVRDWIVGMGDNIEDHANITKMRIELTITDTGASIEDRIGEYQKELEDFAAGDGATDANPDGGLQNLCSFWRVDITQALKEFVLRVDDLRHHFSGRNSSAPDVLNIARLLGCYNALWFSDHQTVIAGVWYFYEGPQQPSTAAEAVEGPGAGALLEDIKKCLVVKSTAAKKFHAARIGRGGPSLQTSKGAVFEHVRRQQEKTGMSWRERYKSTAPQPAAASAAAAPAKVQAKPDNGDLMIKVKEPGRAHDLAEFIYNCGAVGGEDLQGFIDGKLTPLLQDSTNGSLERHLVEVTPPPGQAPPGAKGALAQLHDYAVQGVVSFTLTLMPVEQTPARAAGGRAQGRAKRPRRYRHQLARHRQESGQGVQVQGNGHQGRQTLSSRVKGRTVRVGAEQEGARLARAVQGKPRPG